MGLPDVLPVDPSFPVPEELIQQVLTSEADSGQEQRKLKWQHPKRSFKITTAGMTNAEIDSLRAFWLARNACFDAFLFLPPKNQDRLLTAMPCGTGDGIKTQFTIGNSAAPPYYYKLFLGAGTRNQAYLDGVATAATFSNDDTAKPSYATFSSAPANGKAVTADIDRYLICRFTNPNLILTLEHFGIGSAQYEMIEIFRGSI